MNPDHDPLTFFRKASGSISGPHDDVIRPAHVQLLDYEVEIGLVIGQELPVGTTITADNWPTTSPPWSSPTTSPPATSSCPRPSSSSPSPTPPSPPSARALVLRRRRRAQALRRPAAAAVGQRPGPPERLVGGDMLYPPVEALQALTPLPAARRPATSSSPAPRSAPPSRTGGEVRRETGPEGLPRRPADQPELPLRRRRHRGRHRHRRRRHRPRPAAQHREGRPMSAATAALAGTLAVFFTGLGTAKMRAVPAMRDRAAHLGMSTTAYRGIGALEVAGAAGVAGRPGSSPASAGWPAPGCCSCSAGALVAHLRTGDTLRECRPGPRLGRSCRRLPRRPVSERTDDNRIVPVVIVGAGPTGLTAATLLAQYGVECLVLERWDGVYPQPRAVHLDDEIYRILARLGIADEFAAISRPCRGLRLVDRDMRVLAEFRRDTGPGRHGYPQANMFDQPRAGGRCCAPTWPGTPTAHHPGQRRGHRAGRRHGTGGAGRVHRPGHRQAGVVARRLRPGLRRRQQPHPQPRSAHTMEDLDFEQRWLVVDVATAADLGQWEGVHQVCDPHRAATYMRVGRDPLPLGVPAPARRDRRRLPRDRAAPPAASRRGRGTSRSTSWSSSGSPSTPSAPRSPTGGGTGASSSSATPPTSPRRSSARGWAPGSATP